MDVQTTSPMPDKVKRNEQLARKRRGIRGFLTELFGLRHSDARLYWFCRLTGRNYADYYAARMDRRARRSGELATGHPGEKRWQLDYLIRHGLTPESSLLDFGCGAGSAAVHFAGHLNAEKYVGADISQKCLMIAEERMREHNLQDRRPLLVHLPGGAVDPLQGRSFDFLWAQSVLTHMPPEDISKLITKILPLMHKDSKFFATFAPTKGGPRHYQYKDWFYDPKFFQELSGQHPVDCQLMDDWKHPRSAVLRMVCIRRRVEVSAAA